MLAVVVTYVPLLFCVALFAASATRLMSMKRAIDAFAAGDFVAAESRYDRLLRRSIYRLFPSSRDAFRFNIALCRFWRGDFDEADALVRALRAKQVRPLVDALLGTCVLIRGGDPRDAVAILERVPPPESRAPHFLFRLANARLSAGDDAGARAAYEEAMRAQASPALHMRGGNVVITLRALEAVLAGYFRGWFEERIGRETDARRSYAIAAAATFDSVFRLRAREALERLGPPEHPAEDEPPSLRPFVRD